MPRSQSRWYGLLTLSVAATAACAQGEHETPGAVRALLSALADDSLQGRMTGSSGGAKAAAIIEHQMQLIGLTPAGDGGYFQRVPVVAIRSPAGQEQLTLLDGSPTADSLPAPVPRPAVNVLGLLLGSDPALKDEIILLDAHYDHVGIGPAVKGDSIYNGADDDASGTVAVLEIARLMARGPAPKRTIIFAANTGEEVGLLGTRWFIQHPPRPLDHFVANLEIEMIGRPDSLAGGFGRAWLTGFERSTMGDMLTAAGVPIGPDRRPAEHFFERSDNIVFAYRGIVAHTLSSFNLHADYHQPSDDVAHIDFDHMAKVIDAATRAVRMLADGPRPEWKPGGRPAPGPRP